MSDLTILKIFFRDESIPQIALPLEDNGDGNYSLGPEQSVKLPNGEFIEVYAETRVNLTPPDVLVTVTQNNRNFDIRCGNGVIVSYQTEKGIDVLIQIGTGRWE